MISYFNKNYNLPVCKFRGTKSDIRFPCYASLKLDGELTYIVKKEEKVFSVNKPKYGRWRLEYPALEEFKSLNMPDGIYLAELYWNEGRTKEDFYGLLRNKTSDELKLAIWGILQQYGRTDFTAREVYNYLTYLDDECKSRNFKYLSVAPQWLVADREELEELAEEYIVRKGFEGLVVKREDAVWIDGASIKWVKIKLKDREQNYKNAKYGIWL